MLPLLLLIPGAWLVWTLAQRAAHRQATEHAHLREIVRVAVLEATGQPTEQASRTLPAHRDEFSKTISTATDYLMHLQQACLAAATINTVRSAAMVADVTSLMRAPADVVRAFHALAAPIDMLTAQRDLNLLGAQPALPEDGAASALTHQAIKAFQAQFGQPATGVLDAPSCFALRYSAGVVHGQNQLQQAV